MITSEEALKDLREIAENITPKQWQKLTSKIEHIRNYITQQETKEERAKKEHELLDLYRLHYEFKERYNTQVRLLDQQETLDDIREIVEEIYLKEKEFEELK